MEPLGLPPLHEVVPPVGPAHAPAAALRRMVVERLKLRDPTRMRNAMDKLASLTRTQQDPLANAVLICMQQLESIRERTPSCAEINAAELDRLIHWLADVALWMPLSRESRLNWLTTGHPAMPYTAIAAPDPSRVLRALHRLYSVDTSHRHPLEEGLRDCLLQLDQASRALHAEKLRSMSGVQRSLTDLARVIISHPRLSDRWLPREKRTWLEKLVWLFFGLSAGLWVWIQLFALLTSFLLFLATRQTPMDSHHFEQLELVKSTSSTS